jgi:hypothetical protein
VRLAAAPQPEHSCSNARMTLPASSTTSEFSGTASYACMHALCVYRRFPHGDNGRGEFILLYMLAYAFTVPIAFLTAAAMPEAGNYHRPDLYCSAVPHDAPS